MNFTFDYFIKMSREIWGIETCTLCYIKLTLLSIILFIIIINTLSIIVLIRGIIFKNDKPLGLVNGVDFESWSVLLLNYYLETE